MRTILLCGLLFSGGQLAAEPDQALAIEGGQIVFSGPRGRMPDPGPDDRIVDYSRYFVMPGLSDAHTLRATLTATHYHYGVRLEASHPATHYSDNCFDMMAGEVRTIVVSNAQAELAPGDLTVRTLLRHA